MAEERFTQEDYRLFSQIAIDIKEHPDNYRDAGKWLDEFYNLEDFWRRKEEFLSGLELEGLLYAKETGKEISSELQEKASFLDLMLKSKVFISFEEFCNIRNITREKTESVKEEIKALNSDLIIGKDVPYCLNEEEFIDVQRILNIFKTIEDGVREKHRLSNAWQELLDENNDFLNIEDSLKVCLITWILTDLKAEEFDVILTKFQDWPWKSGYLGSYKIDIGGRRDAYLLLGENNTAWMNLVRAAWAKIELEGKPGGNRKDLIPIDTEGLWDRENGSLSKLREIDSNAKRDGIAGNKITLKRLKEYLTRRQKRKDIAETLHLENGRVKTTMPCRSMFRQK